MEKLKVFVILAPLTLMIFLELFIFPMDMFTTRPWEALKERSLFSGFPGQFYPSKKLTSVEHGDLAPRGKSKSKPTSWETDAFGFRNRQEKLKKKIDVIIVGDSNGVGASVSQESTLSEQLEKIFPQLNVYSYAPRSVQDLLADSRFFSSDLTTPRLVILESIERGCLFRPFLPQVIERLEVKPNYYSFSILMDRLLDLPSYHYVQARVLDVLGPKSEKIFLNGYYFYQGESSLLPLKPEEIRDSALAYKNYQDKLKKMGVGFIFLPIPNKETYFYENWWPTPPDTLSKLRAQLDELKVPNVDLLTVFLEHKKREPQNPPYSTDDSHWNELGGKLGAEALARDFPTLPIVH